MAEIRNYTMNFGPQHPAAHGVLRLVLELDGEVIERADPHIGLLHRATEKLAEYKTWIQSLPYMDRLDYVSMMCNEHAYCLAIERLLGIEVPIRAQYIRTMFDEITRILNHLMWLGAHALDIGAMGPFLYAFRDREDLFDVYEAVSGARMHAAYYRPGGVYRDLPDVMPKHRESPLRSKKAIDELNETRHGSVLDFIESFTKRFDGYVDEYETLLTDNRIWKQRTVGIGVVTPEDVMGMGFSGPMLRGSGIAWDLRKTQPYAAYDKVEFDVPVGRNGDSYDRLWVLVQRMHESCAIIEQCMEKLPAGDYIAPKLPKTLKLEGETYVRTENPLGMMGYYVVGNGKKEPYRLKMRTPSFSNVSVLPALLPGSLLPDLIALLGSIFFVVGDIDR